MASENKDVTKKNLTIRITDQHRHALETKAQNKNTTVSQLIRTLIDKELVPNKS